MQKIFTIALKIQVTTAADDYDDRAYANQQTVVVYYCFPFFHFSKGSCSLEMQRLNYKNSSQKEQQ